MALRSRRERWRGQHRLGLTSAGTVAARDYLRSDSGNELLHLDSIDQAHVGEAFLVLRAYKSGQPRGLRIAIRQHQVATIPVVQIGAKLFSKRGPSHT